MVKNTKCLKCEIELESKANDFSKEMMAEHKAMFDEDMHSPTGYRCPKCGQCYDKNYQKQPWKVHLSG